jgi:hypothetical protein
MRHSKFHRATLNPKTLLDGPGPATAEDKVIADVISNKTNRQFGTSADYLTARIARDRTEILERMNDVMGQPFAVRAEPESTYRFAQRHAPKLLGGTYTEARNAAQRMAGDPEVKPLAAQGRPEQKLEGVEGNKGSDRTVNSRGETSQYIVRRLKREAAEALARGEYRSARAAGIAAGIVKVDHLADAKRAFGRLRGRVAKEVLDPGSRRGDHEATRSRSGEDRNAAQRRVRQSLPARR